MYRFFLCLPTAIFYYNTIILYYNIILNLNLDNLILNYKLPIVIRIDNDIQLAKAVAYF